MAKAKQIAKSKIGKIEPDHAPASLIANVEPRLGFSAVNASEPQAVHIHKSKSGLELPRKAFHSSIGFIVMLLWYLHCPVIYCLYVIGAGLFVISVADVWRFNSPAFAEEYEKKLGVLMRMSEKHKVNGVIWYIIAVMFCLIFYPRDLAVLSIMILSWCDTSASIFGRLFGRYTPPLPFHGKLFAPRKSLAGSLAAAAMGAFAAYLFYVYLGEAGSEGDLSWIGHTSMEERWVGNLVASPTRLPQLPPPRSTISLEKLCAVAGLSAAMAEAIEIWGLDDNLTMAPLAGLMLWSGLKVLK